MGLAEQKLIQTINARIQKRTIRVDGFSINYAVSGSGPALLLVHGLNIGWGQWHPNISELSKHFTVYAPDLPGAGESSRLNFLEADFNKDFVAILDKFIQSLNLQKLHFIGHSLAGWSGLKLAAQAKSYIDKMVLVSSVGFTDYVPFQYKLARYSLGAKILSKTVFKPQRKNFENFVRSVFHENSEILPEFVDYFHETAASDVSSNPVWLIHRMAKMFKEGKELILLEDLPKIRNKVLIIAGASDPLIPPKEVENSFKLLPNAKIKIFQRSGHVPNMEQPEDFNKEILNFLKD